VIPFSANVEVGMGQHLFVPLKTSDGPVQVTQLVTVAESPDARRIAFSAVGKVYVATRDGSAVGAPHRITNGTGREYYPSFSPDGRWVAFASWSDSAGGAIWKARVDGVGQPVRLTNDGAWVSWPRWTPEGDRIVFAASPRQAGVDGGGVAAMGELRVVGANGGAAARITSASGGFGGSTGPAGVSAATNGAPARVYYTEVVPNAAPGFTATQTTALVSVRLDGSDKRTHAKITTSQALGITARVAPDGRGVIVLDRDDIYAFPLTDVGSEGLTVNFATPTVPLRRLTTEGANYADWGDGGRTIVWSFANHLYRAPTDSVLKYADATKWGTTHAVVSLTVPRAVPQGSVLLRGARIVTMRGDEVIEKGDVLVTNDRIAQVGTSLTPPAGARVIDVSGKTIIPGYVDVHAHPKTGREMPEDLQRLVPGLRVGRDDVVDDHLLTAAGQGKRADGRLGYATGFRSPATMRRSRATPTRSRSLGTTRRRA
jgi:hypothetical protein